MTLEILVKMGLGLKIHGTFGRNEMENGVDVDILESPIPEF